MIEDFVMDSNDTPGDIAVGLAELRHRQGEIADALTEIMVGMIEQTGLMAS
jgi:hypothetical protein